MPCRTPELTSDDTDRLSRICSCKASLDGSKRHGTNVPVETSLENRFPVRWSLWLWWFSDAIRFNSQNTPIARGGMWFLKNVYKSFAHFFKKAKSLKSSHFNLSVRWNVFSMANQGWLNLPLFPWGRRYLISRPHTNIHFETNLHWEEDKDVWKMASKGKNGGTVSPPLPKGPMYDSFPSGTCLIISGLSTCFYVAKIVYPFVFQSGI